MSQTPPPQMTPEQQQALEQLREADPAVVVMQAFEMLATGAVVKLGRPDARVLIDALAVLTEGLAARLPEQLVAQLRSDVRQLQMAQVQAEQEAGVAGVQADGTGAGAGEAGATGAADPAAQAGQQSGQAGQTGQRMTDRLWIPGQSPGPRPGGPAPRPRP